MAILEKLQGIMKLRDAWKKIESNEEAINNELISHKTSTQAHKANDIEYSGDVTGATNAKQAIDNVLQEQNNHKNSSTAHTANAITYTGDILGVNNVKQAVDKLKQAQDTLVAHAGDGTKDSELILARGSATVLGDRLDGLDSQLAQTPKRLKSNLTVTSERKRPIITFLDDDTRIEVWTRLKPIFESKNVPCSVACITGRFDNPAHLNAQQVKELETIGWEVMGHTWTHPTGQSGLLEYAGNYSRLEYEIGEGCKDVLTGMGIDVTGFVYPQGGHDFDIREITKKHYDYAFGGTGINDDSLMDSMVIKRIAFGSFTDTNPAINGNNEKNTLAYYKACVDYAKTNNAWLVFMTHIAAQPTSEDAVLRQLIEYIQLQDVDILTARDAYKVHGNRYFAGDVQSEIYHIVDKNNKTLIGKKGTNLNYRHMLFSDFSPTLNIDTPITAFPENSKTAIYMTGNNGVNNGFPSGGVLYVERYANDSYSKRYFEPYSKNALYRSYWNGSSWTDLVKVDDEDFYKPSTNAIFASTKPNEMTENQKLRPFWTKIQASNATGFPNDYPGLVYTDITQGNGWSHQIYYRFNSNKVCRRYWTGTSWSNWIVIGGEDSSDYLKEWSMEIGTVSANSAKSIPVTSGIFKVGDSLVANPKFAPPLGLNWNTYITSNGNAVLVVTNGTTSDVVCPTNTWMFKVLKNV